MQIVPGQVALITGASSGIGRACAFGLAKEGANLIISARRTNIIEKLEEEIYF